MMIKAKVGDVSLFVVPSVSIDMRKLTQFDIHVSLQAETDAATSATCEKN
jgi:hypothetical protein